MCQTHQPGQIVAIVSGNIGQVDDGVRVERKRNTDGTHYWCAETTITHIFGYPCEAEPLRGYGTTEQQARERLDAELKKFNDSLWDEPDFPAAPADQPNANASKALPLADEAGQRATSMQTSPTIECRGLDTPERVCFYEQDFYVLSNFSAFSIKWKGLRFDTSEHAYHWEKFPDHPALRNAVRDAGSAHESLKIATANKMFRRPDWDDVKLDIMREILSAKAQQHEYVRRKLLATGDRELVENSWRDDFWGWGPNRDGQNWLGKLWMEVRAELRAKAA